MVERVGLGMGIGLELEVGVKVGEGRGLGWDGVRSTIKQRDEDMGIVREWVWCRRDGEEGRREEEREREERQGEGGDVTGGEDSPVDTHKPSVEASHHMGKRGGKVPERGLKRDEYLEIR